MCSMVSFNFNMGHSYKNRHAPKQKKNRGNEKNIRMTVVRIHVYRKYIKNEKNGFV